MRFTSSRTSFSRDDGQDFAVDGRIASALLIPYVDELVLLQPGPLIVDDCA